MVVIRHRCDCDRATEPPGEEGTEHVFTVDGEEFPWHISEEGPRITKLDEGWYGITITMFTRSVDADGVPIESA